MTHESVVESQMDQKWSLEENHGFTYSRKYKYKHHNLEMIKAAKESVDKYASKNLVKKSNDNFIKTNFQTYITANTIFNRSKHCYGPCRENIYIYSFSPRNF